MTETINLSHTGGSDAHEPEDVGLCYAEFDGEVAYDNFIDMLKAGRHQGVDTRKSRHWIL